MKYIIILLILTVSFTGCKRYLDQIPNDRLTLEETFRNRSTAERFLASVYSFVPREHSQRFVGNFNSGAWTGGSDEAEYLWGFVESNQINIGSWDVNSGFTKNFWRDYYKGIRNATFFIANIDNVTVDITDVQKRQYKAEARALRAIYYFYLFRIYGPVVLLGNDVIEVDAPFQQLQLPRNTVDECIDYITSELDAAAVDLPVRPLNEANIARITKPIALGIKATALLYAASPLFNGNTDFASLKNNDGKQLIPQSNDASKWGKAAAAYKDFITQFVPTVFDLYRTNNSEGDFDPFLSCRDAILVDWNKETIFGRPDDDNARNYEVTPYHNGFASEVRGSGGLSATQRQVDAFFMSNGRPITDPASGYSTTGTSNFRAPDDNTDRQTFNQWVNREPRFYVNITYDNRRWLNTNSGDFVTRLYFQGNSGKGTSNDYSPTGYIVRKGATTKNWNQGNSVIILLRLANIYLDYVEALNEASPGDADILKYLNLIRERAGVPQYGSADLPAPSGQAAMRQAIRQEKQIELCFENVRYFDTRRWKIAPQTDNGPAMGLDIDSPIPGFYNKKPFETRVFATRHYFFPIPIEDVNNDFELIQNPGW
ncbi:RagB/SusD family nutrient uptake outer membrane protein [Niabella ginsengisoli]|uniref:RagB/SusD family nutrient uptake outer membrane protein n=1 Tax=Niabella ginsengisoli TaxID=522298 RepID=A0ABS9SLB1_9BACT|nr:RagB/SusD family nutrient uptake outer membrane protein [Niabella ginsengisoli]MCH5599174.1 RagB/SusD family nutrient uptake outer membrane protein [Niabella ginsengisoli]